MRFVLVHGGFHGAWCWDRVIPELARLGHEAVAIDVPGHGERADEVPTLASRLDAVVSVLEPGDVLVGHSGGGHEVTRAADARPDLVRHVVYLAAALPIEGRTQPEASSTRPGAHGEQSGVDATGMREHLRIGADGTMAFGTFEGARDFFFHDCDDETARWAFDRLTPERFGEEGVLPISVPRFWAAELPRSFIRCAEDRSQPRWLSDQVADRLGVEPLVIEGSHSPFLSRPAELAELLVHAVGTSPVRALQPTV
ncbi:alpha/beta fold hydrolase [Curtobacterium sp. BRB10]|uniref:alpha/beta fold hydrolase n=1 Tax=Curtobacterium sp. BRB10 TaxID=2962579 RepID=UPI002880D7B3|nr:alpha/beta fold hydrolase [Curtobacterium sp. BRB10]MDT0234841.1 alpha/beta fold hydrolase [Curtobacterium sp. BRB10]